MKCLDLKVVEFKPDFYLLDPKQCGWAWPVIGGKINVKIYVKYEIPRWTYYDRMHIKVRAEKTDPNYSYIGEDDVYIIEDTNESDIAITREKTIEATLEYYDIGAAFKGEDYRKSGWRKWRFTFFTDSGGPTKEITVSAYWDANTCKFTDYDVKGVEELFPQPNIASVKFKYGTREISETGETLYAPVGKSIEVTVEIENASPTGGRGAIEVYNATTDTVLGFKEVIIPQGGAPLVSRTTVTTYILMPECPSGCEIWVRTYYHDGTAWVQWDEKGPYYFSNKEEITGAKIKVTSYMAGTIVAQKVAWDAGVFYILDPFSAKMAECNTAPCEIEFDLSDSAIGQKWVVYSVGVSPIPQPTVVPLIYVAKLPGYVAEITVKPGINEVTLTGNVNQFLESVACKSLSPILGFSTTSECIDFLYSFVDPYYIADVISIFFTGRDLQGNERELTIADGIAVVFAVIPLIPSPVAKALTGVAKQAIRIVNRAFALEKIHGIPIFSGETPKWLECFWKATEETLKRIGDLLEAGKIEEARSLRDEIISNPPVGRDDVLKNMRTWFDGILSTRKDNEVVLERAWHNFRESGALETLKKIAYEYAEKVANNISELRKIARELIWEDNPDEFIKTFDEGIWDDIIQGTESIVDGGITFRELFNIELLRREDWVDKIAQANKLDTFILNIFEKFKYRPEQLKVLANSLTDSELSDMIRILSKYDVDFYAHELRTLKTMKAYEGTTGANKLGEEMSRAEEYVARACEEYLKKHWAQDAEKAQKIREGLTEGHVEAVSNTLDKMEPDEIDYAHRKAIEVVEMLINKQPRIERKLSKTAIVRRYLRRYKVDRLLRLPKKVASKLMGFVSQHPKLSLGILITVLYAGKTINDWCCNSLFMSEEGWQQATFGAFTTMQIAKGWFYMDETRRNMILDELKSTYNHLNNMLNRILDIYNVLSKCCVMESLFHSYEIFFQEGAGFYLNKFEWYINYLETMITPQPVKYNVVYVKVKTPKPAYVVLASGDPVCVFMAKMVDDKPIFISTGKNYLEDEGYLLLPVLNYSTTYHICLKVVEEGQVVEFAIKSITITKGMIGRIVDLTFTDRDFVNVQSYVAPLDTLKDIIDAPEYEFTFTEDMSIPYGPRLFEEWLGSSWEVGIDVYPTPVVGEEVTIEAIIDNIDIDPNDLYFEWTLPGGVRKAGWGLTKFTYTFDKSGYYTIQLRVIPPVGESKERFQKVYVSKTACPRPYATFTVSNIYPKVGEEVIFDASASDGRDGHEIVKYEWDFGDGTTRTTTNPVVKHTFTKEGDYIVRLIVENDCGSKAVATAAVHPRKVVGMPLECPKPYATFTPSKREALVGEEITFDASASDPGQGAKIVEYRWNFRDGTPEVVTTDPIVKHTFTKKGDYIVKLTVKNDCGESDVYTKTISIVEEMPECPKPLAYFIPSTYIANVGQVIKFDASGSKPGEGRKIVRYEWDWGDGTSLETTEPEAQHSYTVGGRSYYVRLTVYNDCGEWDYTTARVDIRKPKGARVEIVTIPSGAKVYINGKLIFERIKRVFDLIKRLRR